MKSRVHDRNAATVSRWLSLFAMWPLGGCMQGGEAGVGQAQDEVDTTTISDSSATLRGAYGPQLPAACKNALPVDLRPKLSFSVSISPPDVIGELSQGIRWNCYVRGGSLREIGGPLTATFREVGADWINMRRDGVLELEPVSPVFDAADGTVGDVRFRSRADMGPDALANFPNGGPSSLPLRVVQEFRTPIGSSLESLNSTRLLGIGVMDSTTWTISFDNVYAFGDKIDPAFCRSAPPAPVEYVTSLSLRARDKAIVDKSDGDRLVQFTYAGGAAAGPHLAGAAYAGATLRAKVHPDGVADLAFQATLRAASGETILLSSGGRASFTAGSRFVQLRVEPDVQASGTQYEMLNRSALLLLGELDQEAGDVTWHLYRFPVSP